MAMKLLQICGMLFLLAACTSKEADHYKVEQEVRYALDQQKSEWNRGDIDSFVDWYLPNDELRFTTAQGMISGSGKLLERYRNAYPDAERMGKLDFEVLHVDVIDANNAIVIGKYVLYRADDRPEGYFTLIWKKTPEGWRIAVDHTT
jgi:ketosteroid isomerase-like protein